MKKAVFLLAVGFMVLPAQGDWQSIKEKALALGDEVAKTTRETWKDSDEWRKEMLHDAGESARALQSKAVDKSRQLLDSGAETLDDGVAALDKLLRVKPAQQD